MPTINLDLTDDQLKQINANAARLGFDTLNAYVVSSLEQALSTQQDESTGIAPERLVAILERAATGGADIEGTPEYVADLRRRVGATIEIASTTKLAS